MRNTGSTALVWRVAGDAFLEVLAGSGNAPRHNHVDPRA